MNDPEGSDSSNSGTSPGLDPASRGGPNDPREPSDPNELAEEAEEAALAAGEPPSLSADALDEVVDQYRERLLAIPGVVGVASGRTEHGSDAVLVWLSDAAAAAHLPAELNGFPLVTALAPGGFHAQELGERE